jgi:hypothetical protein
MSRCVQCGRPKDQHGENDACPGLSTKFASMDLPNGAHCKDCVHFERFCKRFIGQVANNGSCDWFPIRFYPISVLWIESDNESEEQINV